MPPAKTTKTRDPNTLRYTSPLAKSPLPNRASDIKNNFFSSATANKVAGVEVVSETNVSEPLIKEFWAYMDRDGDKTLDDGEYRYTISVFVSRDAGYLREAFESASPDNNEICLFLEDNDGDLFSGRSAFIAVGEDFKNEIRRLRDRAAAFDSEQSKIITIINEQSDSGYSLDFSGAEIAELIRTGRIEDPSVEFFATFLKIVNWQTVLFSGAYSLIGNGILSVTKTVRDYVKFKEKHWDSSAADYSPILSYFANLGIQSYESLSEDAIKGITRTISVEIARRKSEFESQVRAAMSKSYATILISSEDLSQLLDGMFSRVDDLVMALGEKVEEAVRALADTGEKVVSAINAYFCGLWNALVEAVLGLIDILGWIFVAMGAVGEAVSNASSLIPEALELLDEATQAIMSADISGMFSEAVSTIIEEVSSFNLSALTAEITMDKVAYVIGAIVGFIVELVVGLISSGGISSVGSLLSKMGKIGKEMLEFLTVSIKKVLGDVATFSVRTVTAVVRKILAILKGGRAAIRTAIQDIFLVIEKAAVLGAEYITAAARQIGTTSRKLTRWLEDTGMALVKVADEGCAICKVRT